MVIDESQQTYFYNWSKCPKMAKLVTAKMNIHMSLVVLHLATQFEPFWP